MTPPNQTPGVGLVSAWNSRKRIRLLAFTLGLTVAAAAALTFAQERKHKVPGLDKISGGSNQQAFSGKVQSLDMDHRILNVNTVQGGVTEIFPFKKNVRVSNADGDRLKLEDLRPGTTVLIYYDQKGDRRTVKQVIVLRGAAGEAKKPSPHS